MFSEGEYCVYTGRRASAPRAAIVRYVGDLAGRRSVGIEFLSAFSRGHDGYSESCGARGFTCPHGRGLYLSESGAAKKLLPVSSVVDHSDSDAEWQQAVQDIMLHLEERAETKVLAGKVETAKLEGFLRVNGSLKRGLWVKRWVPQQARYLYFETALPNSSGRPAPPAGAEVHPEIQGGPEGVPDMSAGQDTGSVLLSQIREVRSLVRPLMVHYLIVRELVKMLRHSCGPHRICGAQCILHSLDFHVSHVAGHRLGGRGCCCG